MVACLFGCLGRLHLFELVKDPLPTLGQIARHSDDAGHDEEGEQTAEQ